MRECRISQSLLISLQWSSPGGNGRCFAGQLPQRQEKETPTVAIDQIVVNQNGASQTLTPDQWKALPITERVKLLSGAATFFAGGAEVPAKVALQELR
jgi:hypothetical protein